MGPSDAPITTENPVMQDLRSGHAWLAVEHLLDDLRPASTDSRDSNNIKEGDARLSGSPIDAGKITDHGQIKSMSLPPGWVEGTPTLGGIGTRSFREVHPVVDPDATLCFFYRGLPVNEALGKTFRNILDMPPHELTQKEMSSISEILRDHDKKGHFTPLSVRTEDFNGKRVLTLNGRLPKTQEDLKEIVVDTEGTGRVVQEIYFQAPIATYPLYIKSVQDAMKSIEWK
jgi:hypothetical protein